MLDYLHLAVAIGAIIFGTSLLRLHPFLVLLVVAIGMGFSAGLAPAEVVKSITSGFGDTIGSIGIVIVCGTIIGQFLERSGAALAIAERLVRSLGASRTPLAMNLTGYVVSIPIFCDSGFVILAPLNRSLSQAAKVPTTLLACSLAFGLYSTHVFVPPTPGPLAAAAILQANVGLVMLLGLAVSLPVALSGWAYASFVHRKISPSLLELPQVATDTQTPSTNRVPGRVLPFLVPLTLIAVAAIVQVVPASSLGTFWVSLIGFLGHPVIALLLGVGLALLAARQWEPLHNSDWFVKGLTDSGSILLITGAGGAFGKVLRESGFAEEIAKSLIGFDMRISLPFLMAAILKSAQGSSTVAMLTTAAIVEPMLEQLSLASPTARALVVASTGAGAMVVSHFNDSYFWVVTQCSSMSPSQALKYFTFGTLIQGITGLATIALLLEYLS